MQIRSASLIILISVTLASCATPTAKGAQDSTTLSTPKTTPSPPFTSSSTSLPANVKLWVAPRFAPDSASPGGALLAERLASFEQVNPGISVEVRIKDESGPGGLLEALTSTNIAAPAALPDVITLDPIALNTATLKEFLIPLDEFVDKPNAPGWYDYAIEAAHVDGLFFGLPFASDTEVLAYRSFLYPSAPLTWSDILAGPTPFLFPAGDPQAIFTLTQYLAMEGSFFDETGRPMLDPTILADVLAFYGSAYISDVLPPSARFYTSAEDTWAALLSERAMSAVAPFSLFLTESDLRTISAIPLPTRSEPGYSLAETWSWSMVTHDPARQELASRLLAWLTQPDFLGSWTFELRMLPPTAPALSEWPEATETALASSLVTLLHSPPSAEVFVIFGPLLHDAVEAVVGGGTTPSAAALSAVQALQNTGAD